MIALEIALLPNGNQRFWELIHYSRGTSIQRWLAVAGQADVSDNERIRASDLIQLCEAAGGQAVDVVTEVLTPRHRWMPLRSLEKVDGLGDLLGEHLDLVVAAVTPAKHATLEIWKMLGSLPPEVLGRLGPQLCDAATCGSGEVRKVAGELLGEHVDRAAAIEGIKGIVGEAAASRRAVAVRVLAEVYGPGGRADFDRWAAEALAGDRSRAVAEVLAELADHTEDDEDDPVLLPEVELATISPDDPAFRISQSGRRRLSDDEISFLVKALNGKWAPNYSHFRSVLGVDGSVSPTGLTSGHIIRVMVSSNYGFDAYEERYLLPFFSRLGWSTPLEIAAIAALDGRGSDRATRVVLALLAMKENPWTADDLRPWVQGHAKDLVEYASTRFDNWRHRSAGLVELLRRLPSLPSAVERGLVEAAIAGPKLNRPVLWPFVGPDYLDRVTPFLTARTRSERISAAEWFAYHRVEGGGEPLLVAARAEKDASVLSVQLMALEAAGVSVEEFIGPDRLLADATKALKKKSAIPASISWLDPASLPPLRWADGSPVDQTIVTWFLVLATKGKSSAPSPLLRRHLASMEPDSVQAFGLDLFSRWLAHDLTTRTPDEALALAQQHGPQYYSWRQKNKPGLRVEDVIEEFRGRYAREIVGSATASKGLLSLVAASAGSAVVDRALSYIRTHRGRRASQSKSLLEMLAWIDDPVAVQAVMSIASRFRPKGIQAEATKQAELLAERQGWTIEELADRSVPDGDFGPDGRRQFDYGSRTFTAHLGDDLTVSLINDETSKSIRALPQGRADDDDEMVADAKAELKAIKKDLKSTAKLQPVRLQAAMCVQRAWDTDTFERFILRHPVAVRLATRLIWQATNPDGEHVAFRPLTDGTLLGVDDDTITVDTNAEIRIAHELTVAGPTAAWTEHLADYEITPLFAQFGRQLPELSDDQLVIDDVVGHLINTRTLRGQLDRHGWELGAPQDGGIVFELVKALPGSELILVINLHGGISAGYYGDDWNVAFDVLYAIPPESLRSPTNGTPLREVEPVLLAEAYAELLAMAAAGTGYDPDYEKKVN